MVWTTRTVDPLPPTCTGVHAGLAYTAWLPPAARAGVVIIHGAGSSKESHHDFARAAAVLGLGAICFDQRGHGESEGALDGRAVDDVVEIAGVLRGALGHPDRAPDDAGEAPVESAAPLALRGSSMGGYLAILAAAPARARAVVAICPASAAGLRHGLAENRFAFAAHRPALDALLAAHELAPAVAALAAPLLLMHAEGDEQVPIEHSRELARAIRSPGSRLIAVPGGHHRSVQHDAGRQADSLRFITRALGVIRR